MTSGRAIPLTTSADVVLLDVPAGVRSRRGRWAWVARVLWTTVQAVVMSSVVAGTVWLRAYLEERVATSTPPVVRVNVYRLFVDDTPVPVTITAGWEKVTEWTTHDAVRRDASLWRRMHVDDWDRLPAGLRTSGLDAMLARYRHLLVSPATWDRMRAEDWDDVPQPIRALAYRHMAEYWTGYYDVGGAYAIPRGLMADTLSAIILSESWFEHRAVNVNEWGNRDLGLAQASDGARTRMAVLYERGRADFALADEDYFNPWNGTRFAAYWIGGLLGELDGDLGAAVRAYHRGTRRALAGLGREYQQAVEARRRQYIRNPAGTSAWAYLWRRDRTIRNEEWPWMTVAGRTAALVKRHDVRLATTVAAGLAR
jgi:hypothetical protein